ncbi:MAG TPA: 2-keto-4-pentenoate hydratase [Actinobacteria bacterium]|nr:2-keto-4-pentenoate hydratase [Actinomycetota bacterium]
MTPDERAALLHGALVDRVPIPPFTDADPAMTPDDGYAVQLRLVERLLAEGDEIVGYKLGLTSKPMQEMFGVDEPDYGPVLGSMTADSGTELPMGRFIQPKAEAEIALLLGETLEGPGVTLLDAARAVTHAVAAIEVVDSRIEDWRIRLPDTIADLASCGTVVLGGHPVAIDDWEPRLVGMVVTKNGETMGTGAGAAALGDPLRAVAWLANTLAPHGVALEAGRFVMTGSLHAAFDVRADDVVRADFDRLGSVTVRFV